MDQPDLKASEVAHDVEHLHSCESLDSLAKEKVLPNSCRKLGDANSELEKRAHTCDQEITSCEGKTSLERKCPNYYIVSAGGFRKDRNPTNLRPKSSAVSTSRNLLQEVEIHQKENCAEGTYGATSSSNGFASSTIQNEVSFHGNPEDGEVSIPSIEKIDSTRHISVNNDVSSRTGPPLNWKVNELDIGKAKGNWLNAGEDGLHSIVHATFSEIQLKTESSSSNSTDVILPVSSSNDSYQEISVEAKSSTRGSSGRTNFICTGFKCSVEEPGARSVVLDMAAQITRKAVGNVRARESKIELGMIADRNSMIAEKVDVPKSSLLRQKCAELLSQDKEEFSYELDDTLDLDKKVAREVERKVCSYREPSRSSSSIDEKNGEKVHSKGSNKNNCSTESRGVKLCNEQDNCDSFCSNEVVVDPEILTKSNFFSVVKGPPQKTDPPWTHEASDGPHGKESSQLTAKPDVVTASEQSPLGSGFDLNDDIWANEVEYSKQSVDETVSSYTVINVSMPIPVVAKCGVPKCLPMTPLKFKGEQGWRGSASTSAFRPASLSKSSNGNRASSSVDNNYSLKDSKGFTGFDLNVAAVGDDSAIELFPTPRDRKPSCYPSKGSSADASFKGAERLNIDLNCLTENDDNCPQSSLPASLSRHSVVDFDLNDNPSLGDAWISAHQPGQDSRPLRSKAIDDPAVAFMRNSGQQDSNSTGHVYWADMSYMQGINHSRVQPFLVAAPDVFTPIEQMQRAVSLQPKFPFTPRMVPPHIYPYNNGFCIGPTHHLPSAANSSSVLPYITDPHGTTIIPQILGGTSTLSTLLGVPHLMEGAGGPIPSDIRYIRPNFNAFSGLHSSETGSSGGYAQKFSFPVKNPSTEEQLKSSEQVSATPMKRREPEGGWDSFQLGYRQVTYRH